MWTLFAVLRRHSRLPVVGLAVSLGVLSGLANMGLIAIINRTLASGRLPGHPWPAAFAALCLLALSARIASASMVVDIGARLAIDLQVHLSRRVLAAPLRRLEEIGPHRLMATLYDDVTAVSEAISFLPANFISLVVVVGCLCYMAYLAPALFGGVLVAMALGVLTYQLALSAGFVRQRRARESGDELFGHLRGLTQGTKELKTGRRRREEFLGLLGGAAEGFRGQRVAAQKIFIAAAAWGNLLFFVVIGLILFELPQIAAFPAEVRGGFVLALLYLTGPLQVVLNAVPMISQATVALQKIEHLGVSLLDGEEPRPAASALDPRPAWQRLEMVGVLHRYRRPDHDPGAAGDGIFHLGPLDLSFAPGEVVFIVGGNGSGKTTFAKLLLGLYLPEKGEVRWNGEVVTGERLDTYRHLFSVVFSDFFLFEKLLGLSGEGLTASAEEYLRKLRLAHKVRVEDGSLSTIDLSQGQRKRLALLAAYLEDRPIYVFDEWAADQDPEFKEVFYRQILPELQARGKTLFVISHDDRYYDAATRVIKLEAGRVVADQRQAVAACHTVTV